MNIVGLDHFAGCVGQGFDIDLGNASVPLTLAQAEPLAREAPGMARRVPFSLMFRSNSAVVLPQQTYRLRNASLGALEVFLVPVARERTGIIYQAVYN